MSSGAANLTARSCDTAPEYLRDAITLIAEIIVIAWVFTEWARWIW